MKVKLLKKLRKEAKNRFVVIYCDPWYEIIEYYSGRKTKHCDFASGLEEIIKRLKIQRRDFILSQVRKLRVAKINKELKNL